MADETTYSIAELEAMTLPELRLLAKSLKIHTKQRKAELLEDVTETLESAGRLDVEGEEGELADLADLEEDEEETEEDVEEAEEEDEEELEEDEEELEDEELEEEDDEEEDDEEDPVPTPEQLKAAKERHPSVRGAVQNAKRAAAAAKGTKVSAAAAKKAAEPAGDTYTAKQVATRIGTDAKTLRKFFRSADSTIEPVGQGGRYEFDKDDMPAIKAEFEAWQVKSATRRTKKVDTDDKAPAKGRTTRKTKVVIEEEEDEIDEELEFEDEDEELTDEDLDLELEDEE